MSDRSILELFDKQREFADAVFSGDYSYLCYGGAVGGGKSYVALALVIVLCRIFPGSRWAIVRKDLPTLKRNTIPTWEKIAPHPFVGTINRTEFTVKCSNGSEVIFFPETIDRDPELNRWRGLEVNGFILEEANELNEKSFSKAIERAGRWEVVGTQPPPLILLTCNPSDGWVKRLFYDAHSTGVIRAPFYYLPARITDNPHHDPKYLASLENLRTTDPDGYRRFVEGDWSAAEDPRRLIKYEWILNARSVEAVEGKRGLGVDVARYGDDDTTFCHGEGNRAYELERMSGNSITETTELAQARIVERSVDADQVKVDGVGLGAGVVDGLRSEGYLVVEVIGGAKPIPRDIEAEGARRLSVYTYKNLRTQLWWELREAFRLGEICLEIDDHLLVEDLTAPRYSVSGEKVLVIESKDETRKRIGRSPDAGDAVVYWHGDVPPQVFATDLSLDLDIGAQVPQWS